MWLKSSSRWNKLILYDFKYMYIFNNIKLTNRNNLECEIPNSKRDVCGFDR